VKLYDPSGWASTDVYKTIQDKYRGLGRGSCKDPSGTVTLTAGEKRGKSPI
jgi:hypothetical protein